MAINTVVVIGGGLSGLVAHRTLESLGVDHVVVTPRSGWGSMWAAPGLVLGRTTEQEVLRVCELPDHRVVRGYVTRVRPGSLTLASHKEISYESLIYTGSRPVEHVRVKTGWDKLIVLNSTRSVAKLKRSMAGLSSITLVACCDYLGTLVSLATLSNKLGAKLTLIKPPGCPQPPVDVVLETRGIEVYGRPGGLVIKTDEGRTVVTDLLAYLPSPSPEYKPLAGIGGPPDNLTWWLTDPRISSSATGRVRVLYAGSCAIGAVFRGRRVRSGVGASVLTGFLSSLIASKSRPPAWCAELLSYSVSDQGLLNVLDTLLKDYDKSIYKGLTGVIKMAKKVSSTQGGLGF